MASSSAAGFHVRSISMPTGTHPVALKVEEEIQKLAFLASSSTSEASSASAEMLNDGLKGLEDLYMSIEDLLHLPGTQQSMCKSNNRRRLDDEIDASVRLLDICLGAKEATVALKEHVQDLQSASRRKGDMVTAEQLVPCTGLLRREAKKIINNCCKEAKRCSSRSIPIVDGCEVSEVLEALSEARRITLSLLWSVASFVSAPAQKQKPSRWTLVSKMMQKRKVSCEGADGGRIREAHDQLVVLQGGIRSLEHRLECLFKMLIQNRVSLLNLLSA